MMLLVSEKLRKHLLYVGILAALFSGCSAVCPGGWEENNGRCYYFSNMKVASLPWHEAQSQCEVMGANLVVVKNEEENLYIADRLGSALNTWLGLHDLDEYDQWQWVDGTPLTYTNWAIGQPDHWDDGPGGTENCVAIPQDTNGLWNDQSCSIPSAYVCERSNDADTIVRCDTENGWQELSNGRCYKFVKNSVTWTIANDACKAMGAELAAITSEGEQKALSVEVNAKNDDTWIGLSNVNHQQQDYYWSNEVDIFSGTSYKNWADGEPASTSYSSCVTMMPDATNYSPWKTQRCGEENSYICETGLTGSCAPGWRLSQGTCYLYVVAQNAWGTWIDARDYCAAMGANILVLETEKEQQYISQQLPEILDAGANELWLGISDSANDGVWVWEDESKTPVSEGQYTNWNKNQPLNRPDAWDCVQIYTGFYLGRWETADCFMKQPYICEIPPGVDPKPLVPVANTHKGCDPGWLWFDSYCYFFSYNAFQWTTAEGKCMEMGGHLVSILSGKENSFVIDHLSGSTWIGGHAVTDVYNFQWSDNSPWGFTNWATGEPSNVAQGCAQLWLEFGYMWDDTTCESVKSYVCKKHEQDCWEPLGMEDRTILDSQITASSQWDENHAPYYGRLNNNKDGQIIGAWASSGSDRTQGKVWFQVHLVPERTVAGITTQGRPQDSDQYVSSYKVAFSNDGQQWQFVKISSNDDYVFTANADSNSKVTNKLPQSLQTSYIRIYPWTWLESPTMRVEFLGCTSDGNELPTTTPNTDCTSVSYQSRLDCGYTGVTASECRSRGCCWDSSVPDTIWCFYKKGDFDNRCGKDWIYDPGGQLFCYHFNPYKIRDRNDAQLYCYNMGGDLLSINSMHEQYYVTAHVTGLVSASALWIGVNRLDDSRGWQWSNGYPFNYKYWRGGEPNDWSGEEYCVEMYTTDGTWNDNPCYYQRGIACKKGVNSIPISTEDGNVVEDICEGDTGTLVCGGNQVILVHHASYGRNSPSTCGEGDVVPIRGCHSFDSLKIVSQMCNGQTTCTLEATNEVFGDPCTGTYKYLNVIYSCETVTCLEQLGMENGTITDDMISESSAIDGVHTGKNGRLNSASSWATNEEEGAWIQVSLSKHMRISGIMIQGANDADKWITTFKVAYAKDETNAEWVDYKDYDDKVVIFDGTEDRNTIKQIIFAERIFSTGIRIYPLTWKGLQIGMRMEVTGCNPFEEVTCNTVGDVIYATGDVGTIKTLDCPAYCPEKLGFGQYEIYGDKIYAGNSQICPAAIHAGVLLDRLGGAVTVKKELGQSAYEGTQRNGLTSQDLNEFRPIAFSFTSAERNCETGWIPYDQYCFLPVVDAVPWQSAEAACTLMDGHLVSIFNSVESDFVWQIMTLSGQETCWTGLSSLISANEYTWTDSSMTIYTHWGYKQPDRSVKSCVFLRGDTGMWDDHLCEDPRPFICKKYKGYYQHDAGSEPTPPPGCNQGWVPYDDKCYLFERAAVAYIDSKTVCADQGGIPVDILDKFTQSFIHTVIGTEDFRWWLGVKGSPEVGGSSWAWESGYPMEYDNWGRGSPDITKGECAVFYGGQAGGGMWYSHRCEKAAYSMCQMQREGYVPPPKTTLPPVGGCPGGWETQDEDSGWCYRAYLISRDDIADLVGWNNAYHQCLATGGDLVSLHSSEENQFILALLKTQLDGESAGLWIGLNNRAASAQGNENGWEWSDGSGVSYTSWSPGYPDVPRERNCVELRYEADGGARIWKNIDCDQKREFICKLKKGLDAISPTVPPTGKPNLQCGASSDGVWLEYNEWCYLFNNVGSESWHSAEDKCLSAGANLLSVHYHNEQSFITNQITQMNGSYVFWTGLREIGGVDGEFAWSDGSPVDYVNWLAGEPNDAQGMEQCVSIIEPSGKWNDANCGLAYAGFICKRRIGETPIPPQPTDPWPGGCPSGWLMYDNFCYQVHGEYTVCATDADDWSDGQCRAKWYDARDMCRDAGGDLVTIHNKYENAFVAAQIVRLPINAWIGFSDESWYNKYHWSTGEEVTYTNWYAGEPNHVNGEERCAEMHHREDSVGRWNDNLCENVISYICQKKKDPSITPGSELNNNNKCPGGWMQYDTINENYICYYLDQTERTFADAQSNCGQMKSGANLVSFQTMYEQGFVTSYIREESAWIGLQFDPDQSRWIWVDNWPVWITNWGEHEPGSNSKPCAMSKDSVLGSEWVTADCNEQHKSVCRWTTESVPPTPGTIEGDCPDNDWQVYGGFCYREFPSMGDPARMLTWSEAETKCTEIFGHLVSIGSRAQTEWINSWTNTSESLWIGLRDNSQGGWTWTDNRPVAYTNWNTGEPNDWGENGEDCGEYYPGGKWNDNDCGKMQGFMCRIPKVIATDENGNVIHYQTPVPEPVGGGSNAGVIVGAVLGSIAALVLIAAVGYYLYKNDAFRSKTATTNTGSSAGGFDNPQYSVSASKGFDDIGASNA